MSAQEILEALPKLTAQELELIYRKVLELHLGKGGQGFEPSAELLEAIDQGDQSLCAEGSVSLEEARREAQSWKNTK